MSFLKVNNTKLAGLSIAVPKQVDETKDYEFFSPEEVKKYIDSIGVVRKHRASKDQTSSDLCFAAAEKLIDDLKIDKSEIDLLIFASHSGDYKIPSTSCILQQRLGLSTSIMAFDINHGCSGFIYGMGILGNLISTGSFRKGLLLAGNTQSKNVSYYDQSTYLIFGDAGTAALLEYAPDNADTMEFNFFTDGSEFESVYIPDGGYRNPITPESFKMEVFGDGIKRNRTHLLMNGTDVFSFANSYTHLSVVSLMKEFNINSEDVDYLVMHQANKFLCEKIRKKVKFPAEKTPYSFENFGNTSAASIPLTMVLNLKEQLATRKLNLLLTAIGGGFSIASARLITSGNVHCSNIIYI